LIEHDLYSIGPLSINLTKDRIMEILVSILIGAAAGWLGSMIYRGSGLGLLGNIIVGIIGGPLGYWILGKLGVTLGGGWVGAILTGAIGAIVILLLINLIFKKK
jgi:uncharacterized membrane protein YeaQ/YmgE (transglycosylase-associated protein family)